MDVKGVLEAVLRLVKEVDQEHCSQCGCPRSRYIILGQPQTERCRRHKETAILIAELEEVLRNLSLS
jgi:hypothetical protein